MSDLLDTTRAAKMLGMSPATVRRWIIDGALAHVVTPGGRYYVPRSEIERILTPIPADGFAGEKAREDSSSAFTPPPLF